MSHGYVDDIPGHSTFWNDFRCKKNYSWRRKDYKPTWDERWWSFKWALYGKNRYRYRLLKRLWKWNRNIKRLRKAHPGLELREYENWLVYLEVQGVLAGVCGGPE